MEERIGSNYFYSRDVNFEVIRRTMEISIPYKLTNKVCKSFYCVNYNAIQEISKDHSKGIVALVESSKIDYYKTSVYKMFDAYVYQLLEEIERRKSVLTQNKVKSIQELYDKIPDFRRDKSMDLRVYTFYGMDSYLISNGYLENTKRVNEVLAILKECNDVGITLILLGNLYKIVMRLKGEQYEGKDN